MTERDFWNIPALGELPTKERAAFYDALAEDEEKGGERFLFGGSDSSFFENPTLRVGILEQDGSVVPAAGYTQRRTLQRRKIRVFLERYFVHAMPGQDFNLQIAIRTRHQFQDLKETSEVAHTLAVRGIQGDYVNYLTEPVFSDLSIEDNLSLEIAVIYIGDKTTDRILDIINNENVKKGITLAGTFNPIFGVVANYVRNIGVAVLKSRKNQEITRQQLTLLSEPGKISLPLIEGDYILVQPKKGETELSFSGIQFDSATDRVTMNGQPLARNHMLLRILAQQ